MMDKYYIGCSGYYYKEWKGKFYPADLPPGKWLEYYCTQFNTIEINSSFYHFPKMKTLENWYNKTPSDFIFSIKVPQLITHFKRFNDTQELQSEFYTIAEKGLKEKLQCVLFQLPPSLSYEPELLNRIIRNMDSNYLNVIEFRHQSWWNENVYEVLEQKKIIFCSVSYPGLPEKLITTSPTIYIRFHGNKELYKSSYTSSELAKWSEKVKLKELKEFFVYFNNTWHLNAIDNAKTFRNKLINDYTYN